MNEILTSYNLIIEASAILILSFFFSEIARKTNIPSVLMLIILGIVLNYVLKAVGNTPNFFPILEVLGIVGLIMIVLEAALELKLKREKLIPIAKAFIIALTGLLASTWVAALILEYYIPGMTTVSAWLYATPLSILSSAIIIPSVSGLAEAKKEFHIYESTFSDILGIMIFYFLTGQLEAAEQSGGLIGFGGNVLLTIVLSVVASYIIVLIFQNIKSDTKLFLLIAVLLLLYAVGKKMHLSSLIIILVFGLLIANMSLFFQGPLGKWLQLQKAKQIYDGLHIITMETAFVVRTFFFVIFGLTIELASLASLQVVLVSLLIILSIYVIRLVILRIFVGKDILPQLFIAPRGLITVLLFYAIPEEAKVIDFEAGILLFIIIGTSVLMTIAMIYDKGRTGKAMRRAEGRPVGYERWKAPSIQDLNEAPSTEGN
ncbi:MAG: cation:proton antiporter [Bacteroidota bacterium]